MPLDSHEEFSKDCPGVAKLWDFVLFFAWRMLTASDVHWASCVLSRCHFFGSPINERCYKVLSCTIHHPFRLCMALLLGSPVVAAEWTHPWSSFEGSGECMDTQCISGWNASDGKQRRSLGFWYETTCFRSLLNVQCASKQETSAADSVASPQHVQVPSKSLPRFSDLTWWLLNMVMWSHFMCFSVPYLINCELISRHQRFVRTFAHHHGWIPPFIVKILLKSPTQYQYPQFFMVNLHIRCFNS